ncbi:hypothetical protein RJ641_004544 [Dillenia turbinata]|uniref:Uncharacterized protein n=1 Tax=Dillenia turbinata TaxID=194707 RepID=A0AAN8ZD23_9MAGN
MAHSLALASPSSATPITPSAVLGLRLGNQSASAAARRPPPPPPTEKNDPNLSGLQAKVLASKKRKEALKEEVAKLRERGRPILEATTPTPTPTPTE